MCRLPLFALLELFLSQRGGYQSNYGGYQDARTGAGGDRGGFSRYGSGGPSSGGFRGEMRPRGNSYDAGPGEAYPKRQYNVPPSRGSSGLQVAATLFGGAPASSGDSNHEEMDGAQEEVRALELARMEREAILHKKKQLELQQQRLAEQEKEREAVREKHNAMIALPQPVDSQQEAVGGDYNRSARGIGGGYSGTRDDRGFAEERHRHISDGEDSWRRGPSWPSGTSNAHGDSRDDAFGRRAAAHRGPERLTSGPEAVSKMQQGTVHVMHRPPAAMTDTSNKGEVVSSSQHAHSGSQIHQNIAAAHHHGPTEARQLYDPKTGSFYASDRTGKPIRSNSHDEGNSNNKNAPREDKPIKIKSKEKRSGSEDKTHHEPEESVAARKAREEAAAKKEARDKEKASRPPHSKGLLFRYTDEAKTVGMIEQVLSAEEAAKKASDDAQKQKKMDDKVDGKRQKLKALEDRKIRDLLKRSGTESANKQDDSDMKTLNKNEPSPSAKPTSVENDSNFVDEDHEDDNSSVDAALMADYLLASGAKKNVEPIGVVGTIVFGVPANSFILSEPEALADFTEVTRKRAAKPVVAPVPSSGKKRNRNERAENSLKKDFVPASKEPQANRELTIVAPTVPTAPVPQVI